MPKPLTVWITITVENSERDGNTRPPDGPLGGHKIMIMSVCLS